MEKEKIDTTVWKQDTVGTMRTKLHHWLRETMGENGKNGAIDDARLGTSTKNSTIDAYLTDATRLGAMHALGKHGIQYHEKGYFTAPAYLLFTHVPAPDPENPAKTKLVPNKSKDHMKILRHDIDRLFKGRATEGKNKEVVWIDAAFEAPPKNGAVEPNRKGRPAKKAGMVSAKAADTHTAAHAPMEIEFAKADGKSAIKVTITPDTTTSETEQAKTKEALGLPVVSLATALATLLGARIATKSLGELGERTRNALNELAQRLEQAEEAFSKMDEENEKRSNGKAKKAA